MTCAAVAVVGLAVAGCSSGDDPAAPSVTTAPARFVSTTSASTGDAVSTTTLPAAPAALVDDATVAALADVVSRLPVEDTEARCVAERLSTAPDMVAAARATGDVTPLAGFVRACKQITFGHRFAASVNESNGGTLTDTQLRCLSERFAALPADQLDVLIGAGVNPQGERAGEGVELMRSTLTGCEVQAQ
jgi:hypothetical protein